MSIVVVGRLNIDYVVRVPRFPQPGETLTGVRFETFAGGTGANQVCAAARLGARVQSSDRWGTISRGTGCWASPTPLASTPPVSGGLPRRPRASR